MAAYPLPVPGLVIRYSYLWEREYRLGQDEGIKDRPCAIILTTATQDGETVVMVLPVTHTSPKNPALAVEIPAATKRRMGLDDAKSWIVLSEANKFVWPGPDLRPMQSGEPSTIVYGLLPRSLFHQVREKLIAAIQERQMKSVPRD